MIVIGVGNPFRRDDGVGPAVIEELRRRGLGKAVEGRSAGVTLAVTDGEPARLIELWAGQDLAVVVDAVRAEPPRPGRVHEFGRVTVPGSGAAGGQSSHGLGLDAAVELGEALGRMPGRLLVFAVEGADFSFGPDLSPPVAAAVRATADRIAGCLAGPREGTAV